LAAVPVQGDPEACDRLARCYQYGHGVEQNFTKAIDFYQQAVNKGGTPSFYDLGQCYEAMGKIVEAGNCYKRATFPNATPDEARRTEVCKKWKELKSSNPFLFFGQPRQDNLGSTAAPLNERSGESATPRKTV
jgi:tetratricopeptide (TPR) repeat protein